jgi:DegV family protein with EDD domain
VTVAVVTDSAAALPPELAAANGVTVVPLHLVLGGEDHLDGSVGLDRVVAELEAGVTTSAPSPGEFAQAIGRAMTTDGVVVLTIAGDMSATCEAARAGAALVEGPVTVVDTRTAAGAQGLVVLAAARAAASGQSRAEVADLARRWRNDVRLMAVVDGLEHLVRSGRVPGVAGWAGRVLGLQPLFEFRAGRVHRLVPAHGREHALDRIVSAWERSRPAGAHALHIAALHARAEDQAHALLERVSAVSTPATSFVGEFSPVMVAHTGPGLVGLAWAWSEVSSGPS